jgi:hypothetical protein
MRHFLYAIVFLIFSFNLKAQTQIQSKTDKLSRVSRTYGYLLAQQYSLIGINEMFPQLKQQIIISSSNFNSSFGNARINIDKYLRIELGEKEFRKFFKDGEEILENMKSGQVYTIDNAKSYLSEVDKRAKGEIPTPVLETLLYFQYIDNPLLEYSNGYTRVFQSAKHPKSKGVDMQIKAPLSWMQKEGDRPNVVQKYVSDFGDGFENIVLTVKEYNENLSQVDFNNLYSKEGAKLLIPKDAEYITSKRTKIDQVDAIMIIFNNKTESIGMKMNSRVMFFVLIYEKRLITLTCLVGSLGSEIELQKRFDQIAPLFTSVARSIVFNDQYK